ncbi:cyanase [Aciditerrimonas ferrireducens]|jgi:cyanate lyase|uniref:Cyanate hydratase n=1 Tax=Aciditerrimonas ferrireducens TaxID=667306 RepID=A0ABV6C2W5_9ACTN
MDRLEAGEAVRRAVRTQGRRWSELAELLGRSVVWTTSALLGQQPLGREQAELVAKELSLGQEVVEGLCLPPVRGAAAVDRSEPVVYRLEEVVQVYGSAVAELVAEEFGDGIMSAIDFEMDLRRESDPKGDRVVLTLSGKFLPYRVW